MTENKKIEIIKKEIDLISSDMEKEIYNLKLRMENIKSKFENIEVLKPSMDDSDYIEDLIEWGLYCIDRSSYIYFETNEDSWGFNLDEFDSALENKKLTSSVEVLDLSSCRSMKNIPESIVYFENLTKLVLPQIIDVPKVPLSLVNYPKLNHIEVRFNRENEEDIYYGDWSFNSFKRMKHLKKFTLHLTDTILVPCADLNKLKQLTYLKIFFWCDMRYYNEEYCELYRSLFELKNLKYLSIVARGETLQAEINDDGLTYWHTKDFIEIPDMIEKLTELEYLEISAPVVNQKLPSSIRKLKNLKTLIISNCDIREVPNFIYELPNIEVLDVSGNYISDTTIDFSRMKKLKKYIT